MSDLVRRTIKYYQPSLQLVNEMQRELRFVHSRKTESSAEEGQELSGKSGAVAKGKYDEIERIFQALVDVVFFLEFIEDHPELHETYENILKDLFGINYDDSSPQPYHYKNRSSSLFIRFINSALFGRSSQVLNFQVVLINWLISSALHGIQFRIDNNLRDLLKSNIENLRLLGELFESKYNEEPRRARRTIGYCIPFDHRVRQELKRNEKEKMTK